MKFLSICTMKDTFSMLPPSTIRNLMESSVNWMNQQKKAGKVLEVYSIPGGGRSAAICEHSSAEDLSQVLATMPMSSFMNFEIYPLADFNEFMKVALETVKAAERMYSSQPKETAAVR
jgi:muconolactone delta-isomerase